MEELHSFSPEVEGPGGSWCWGWRGCWCGWVGMEECWGRTLGRSSPCRAARLDPEELMDGQGLSVAPTPAMAGSASRMSLARDSAKPPSLPRSSTSEMTVLVWIFQRVYYCSPYYCKKNSRKILWPATPSVIQSICPAANFDFNLFKL